MRVTVMACLLFAAGAALPADAAMRVFPVAGFDAIAPSGIADVSVHTGAAFSARADGDDDAVQALLVDVVGGTLRIRFRPGTHLLNGKVRVSVAMPRLAAIRASGTGAIAVDHVGGPAFTGEMSGTGSLKLPNVAVERIRLAVSGTSHVLAAGTAAHVDLDLSGTGGIDAGGLAARDGRIDASGVGSVVAQVNGPVDVSVSGVAKVSVGGHPACTVHRSGMGSVRCG